MISFDLQPDLQFKFFLARELHMTVKHLCDTMDTVEFHQWGKHFQRKAKAEKDALENSRNRLRKK